MKVTSQEPEQTGQRSHHRSTAMPLWFSPLAKPLLGWLHHPSDRVAELTDDPAESSVLNSGGRHAGSIKACVVLCPALGYESWTAYQSYRQLAESLSTAGFLALRFDYDGTGDSAGHELEAERLPAWRQSVQTAVNEFAARCPGIPVVLMGLRFGASLALEQARALGIDTLVLWDPVISGRRYVRELKMLARPGAPAEGEIDDGILEIAGCLYAQDTIDAMSGVDLMSSTWAGEGTGAGKQLLLLERDDRQPATAFVEKLRANGAAVDVCTVTGTAAMMDVSTEDAEVPANIINTIVDWLSARFHAVALRPLELAATDIATMDVGTARISEQLLRIAPLGLFGILGRPADRDASHAVIFLSSGTEHRIGPGRAWVSLSRSMNSRGVATLRLDFDGVGDSPMRGDARRVRPYDPQFFDDVRDAVTQLRARGFTRVTVLGLCSGAWMAIQAGIRLPVDSIVAINPQLYWQQGDPVESLLQDTRVRRAPMRQHELKGERYGAWTLLDLLGIRPMAGHWLDALVNKQVRTLMAFAKDDDGLQYLRIRCGRRLRQVLASGVVSVTEVAGIDHPMHRHRKRPEMFAAITDFVTSVW